MKAGMRDGDRMGGRLSPSIARRSRAGRLVGAVGLAGLLCVAALAGGDLEAAQAQDDVPSECTIVPDRSGGQAICTYTGFELSVELDTLVDSVGGGSGSSGIWIQAWGGGGADGGIDDHGGAGAPGGYAQTYYDRLSSYQATYGTETLFFSIGKAGSRGRDPDTRQGGGGGAATLLASANAGLGTDGPCIVADPNAVDGDGNSISVLNWSADGSPCDRQNVVALAGGGGGGGGHAHRSPDGKAGGRGGVAVATTATVAATGTNGDSGFPSRVGIGGFNGVGGKSHKFPEGDATDGIGGLGGTSAHDETTRGGYAGTSPPLGTDNNGVGGNGYDVQDDTGPDDCEGCEESTFGGGGGGGFGGGGGGGGAGRTDDKKSGGSGGGGGGSYAHKGDSPPSNPPTTGAPSADQGAVRIVIDGVGRPTFPPPPCIITLHGTGNPETLTGTTGGDDMYGYEGTDSIIAGSGDDCAYGGAGGDTMLGGPGEDTLFADSDGAKAPALAARRVLTRGPGDDVLGGGRGADRVVGEGGRNTLKGGRGPDRVNAKGGRHSVRGGRGADRIRASDGRRDSVRCGSGIDVAWVDARDRVARDCERVHTAG